MCAAVDNLNKTEFVVKYFYASRLWVFQRLSVKSVNK